MKSLGALLSKLRPTKTMPLLLGDIRVQKSSDLQSFLELNICGENSAEDMKSWICELLGLPLLSASESPPDEAMLLDIALSEYRVGSSFGLQMSPFLGFFWRPSVTIAVRLRDHKTNEVLVEHWITKRMNWGTALGRLLSPWVLLRVFRAFNPDDLTGVLRQALLSALQWSKKSGEYA